MERDYFHTHMHAQRGCQACGLVRVASSALIVEPGGRSTEGVVCIRLEDPA